MYQIHPTELEDVLENPGAAVVDLICRTPWHMRESLSGEITIQTPAIRPPATESFVLSDLPIHENGELARCAECGGWLGDSELDSETLYFSGERWYSHKHSGGCPKRYLFEIVDFETAALGLAPRLVEVIARSPKTARLRLGLVGSEAATLVETSPAPWEG